MKNYLFLLFTLVGCGQNAAERPGSSVSTAAKAPFAKPTPLGKTAEAYDSGDRPTTGPNDTLHVGNGVVLQLKPGNKADFAKEPPGHIPYSEARVIRQEGGGRVYRTGHTLVVRPFNGPALRFSDDTHELRRDDNEERDTHCQFSGSVPGRPYWVVDSLQWERYQPFLINKYSGRATHLSWDPEISPNRQLLFIASPGLDIESSLNGLQLLAVSDQAIAKLWTRTLTNWQPQRVRWLDNHIIAIEQLRFEPKVDTTYVRLLLPH